MDDASQLAATTSIDHDAARARETARANEVNDGLPRPYAGTHVTVVLPPSDIIAADYVDMGYLGQWCLGGELEGVTVFDGGEILAGDMNFGGPEGARKWAAALLSAAAISEAVGDALGGRRCRACGCTDAAACETITGPCAWLLIYDDGTGICTACPLPENQAEA